MAVHERLETIFRDVFGDEQLVLRDEMTRHHFPKWDSFAHVNLMFSIERAFGVRFNGSELAEVKSIGELKRLLGLKKLS